MEPTRSDDQAAASGSDNGPSPRVEWPQLRDLIEGCDAWGVFGLLTPHSPAELAHLVADLKALRVELRKRRDAEYRAVYRQYAPMLTAWLMCAQTPAQVAPWITDAFMLHCGWSARAAHGAGESDSLGMRILLSERRDPAWTAELAGRLAAKLRPEPDTRVWRIATVLAARSGAELPLSDGYVVGWVAKGGFVKHDATVKPKNLLDWLRIEPRLRDFVPRLFEIPGLGMRLGMRLGVRLGDGSPSAFEPENAWPRALPQLAREGILDRAELIDLCTAKLLRGDESESLRAFTALLEQLAPSIEEVAERLATYTGLATAAPGPLAKLAQAALIAVDSARSLEPDTVAELSTAILSRTEAGLATTQLSWLAAVMRRDPDTVPVLLPAAAQAFSHPAASVQQRTIKLVGKYAAAADARLLAELREAAQALDPALLAEAEGLLGAASGRAPHRAPPADPDPISNPNPSPNPAHAASVDPDASPDMSGSSDAPDHMSAAPTAPSLPPYHPTPMPPALGSAEELAAQFAIALANRPLDHLAVERVMEAVAVLAYQDLPALAAAFEPLSRTYPGGRYEGDRAFKFPGMLRCLFDAVLGADYRQQSYQRAGSTSPKEPTWAAFLRVNELADRLLARKPVPVLLATPTAANGAIDPAVLLERLRAYERADRRPMRHDLQQALMRLTPAADADEALQKALAGLPGRPGPLPEFEDYFVRGAADPVDERGIDMATYILKLKQFKLRKPPPVSFFDSDFTPGWVIATQDGPDGPELPLAPKVRSWVAQTVYWPTVLPHHPDLVGAHAIPLLHEQAAGGAQRSASPFPLLAETEGVPGHMTHLALAYGLCAAEAEHRIAAVDALLILAARGLLRPEQLGCLAAELVRRELIKMNRLVGSLADAEQAGAGTAVFETAAAAIGELADTPELRGLPDLLLLATRCARNVELGAGVRADNAVPRLSELAALTKPARVGVEARRLQDALRARQM